MLKVSNHRPCLESYSLLRRLGELLTSSLLIFYRLIAFQTSKRRPFYQAKEAASFWSSLTMAGIITDGTERVFYFLPSFEASFFCAAFAFRVTLSKRIFGRLSRIRHRNDLTENGWEDSVKGLDNFVSIACWSTYGEINGCKRVACVASLPDRVIARKLQLFYELARKRLLRRIVRRIIMVF